MLKNNMNQQPLVSIIIPTYNREKYIKKAVESALSQTYKNIEIIIIDGSPNNNTEEVVQPYSMDFRIRYIHQQELRSDYRKDRNASRARNKGIRISKGKYIATLDDDDFWCDQRKLEKQVQFLENHPDYVVCGGGVVVIREENPEKPFLRPYYPEKDEDIRKRMLFGDAHVHSSLVFRKEVWETIGGYDEKLPFGDDWNFYLRLGKVGKLYNFPEYFTYFLLGQQNKTDRVEYKRESLGVSIRFIKKYRNDYPGFPKAILLAWACYFYSFLPFGESLRPVFVKIKHRIFDPFLYK